MLIERYAGFEEWKEALSHRPGLLREEVEWRDALAACARQQVMAGYCCVCGQENSFLLADLFVIGDSLREHLSCAHCGSISRHRAVAMALSEINLRVEEPAYITEQATPFYVSMQRRFPGLTGSEFVQGWRKRARLTAWLWRHGVRELLRFEDATSLSFLDARMAAIVSMDVLEHVPDYRAALREFVRVLRPGGALVLTVPFYCDHADNDTIAWIREDGRIEHVGEPEYHGDPVSDGVLCFHHFGWELLASMRVAGFSRAEAWRVAGQGQGVPEPVWVLIGLR